MITNVRKYAAKTVLYQKNFIVRNTQIKVENMHDIPISVSRIIITAVIMVESLEKS